MSTRLKQMTPQPVQASRSVLSLPSEKETTMTKQSIAQAAHQEIAGVIEIHRNQPMVSSLKIAELFERRHDSVLRAIRKVPVSEKFFAENFVEKNEKNTRGRFRPVFYMTAEGQKELTSRFIPYNPKHGYVGLYVILFSTGVVKVGKSNNPDDRIKQHKKESAKYGVFIISYYVSKKTIATEKELIDFVSRNSEIYTGSEYFINADFEKTKAWMVSREITDSVATPSARIAAQQQTVLPLEVVA